MEHTELLQLIMEKEFSDIEMAIHPNDGQDLNLFTREHRLMFYAGHSVEKFKKREGQLGEGELHLLNDCKLGTLMISESLYKKLNFCEQAVIIRDSDNLFLAYS